MTEIDETKQKKLYKELYSRLVSLARSAGVNEEKLQDYFTPEPNKNFLEQLAISLQNSGRMQNSIKYDTNENQISDALCKFKIQDAYNEYCKDSKEEKDACMKIYKAIWRTPTEDQWEELVKTNKGKYCKGLYTGLKFLVEKDKLQENKTGLQQMKEFISEKTDKIDEEHLEHLLTQVSNIANKIHGLGFALTCDWLKECGCTWLAKPDAHIKAVVKYMTGKKEEEKIKDEDVCKYIFNWAKAVPVSAYQLDKIIWLLCTGNFYLHDVKIGRNAVCKTIDEVLEIKYPTCFI